MKYKLIKPVNPTYSALEQVLTNRGVKYEELNHYCNTTDDDINSPLLLGEDNLKRAVAALVECIQTDEHAGLIIDADTDGFTSSALLYNYLYDIWPTWTKFRLDWYLHEGKQHGLKDLCDKLMTKNYKLILVPDAGSGDIEESKKLREAGAKIIILDHHPTDLAPADAIVINNQLSDYPNKQLSGVGVTWQFCKYIDFLLGKSYADQYLDLVALGLNCLG